MRCVAPPSSASARTACARRSRSSRPRPSRVAPASPTRGLWQLGARVDHVDLDDGAVAGGTMDALTLGVNWYWSRHLRLSANYVMVDSERMGLSDDPDIVEARVQLHW